MTDNTEDTVEDILRTGNIPLRLKIIYRVPPFLLTLYLAILVTILLPILIGWLAGEIAKLLLVDQNVSFVYLLGLWGMGLAVIGGISASLIGTAAIWSATSDAGKRLWKYLRGGQ